MSSAGKLLLVDHKLAGLWLPSGGHVEPGEDPRETVVREIAEELNLAAEFVSPDPLFITVTRTVGDDGGHTDVSLWYLLRGDSSRAIEFDRGEFHGVRWFGFDEIPFERIRPAHAPLHARSCARVLRSNLALRSSPLPTGEDLGEGPYAASARFGARF